MRKILGFFFAFALAFMIAPAAAPAQRGVASIPGPAYRINPGDDLEISVWGDERLQKVVRVLPDGTIGFPLVGQVMAAGMLPSDLARVITVALKPQYRDVVPQVTVSVKSPNGYQFSVLGKVKNPGTFTPGRYVNALEALAIAGGPTEFAQTGRIYIIRKAGPNQVVTIPVRVGGILKGDYDGVTPRDIPPIESGDTMEVP
ncbi:MAG TPA: polysaccharide biosynthesis/export family protein [Tepidisphaeraceae bacterium]|nr:polysaccharide biosynthesis/export family protein [Tepidisphaeraceae bacterium]